MIPGKVITERMRAKKAPLISDKKDITGIVIFMILALLSLPRCFFSIDYDEAYTILTAVRPAMGHRLFMDLWEAHQTSAMFLSILLKPYIFLNGGTDGIVIYARVITVSISFFTTLVLYMISRSLLPRVNALLVAVAFFCFLPRGTASLEYGVLQQIFVVFSLLFFFRALENNERDAVYNIVFAGIFWSAACLCYPILLIITLIYLLGFIFYKKDRLRYTLIFCLTCFGCAIFFLTIVFVNGTPWGAFQEAIENIFLDPTHTNNWLRESMIYQIPDILKKLAVFLILGVGYVAIIILWEKRIRKKEIHRNDIPTLLKTTPFFIYFAVMLIGGITGFYRAGAMGIAVGFLFFSMIAVPFAIKEKKTFWLWIMGIAIYVGSCLQGDLGPKDYMNFLYIPVLYLCAILPLEHSEVSVTDQNRKEVETLRSEGNNMESDLYRLAGLGAVLFSVAVFYTRAFCVKANDTGYSFIWEKRERCETGALQGVYLYPEEAATYERKQQQIRENTGEDDCLLVLDREKLGCLSAKCDFVAICYYGYGALVPVFDDGRWIQYVNSPYHKRVTKIYLDKADMSSFEEYQNSLLGQALYEQGLTEMQETEDFYIVTKR